MSFQRRLVINSLHRTNSDLHLSRFQRTNRSTTSISV